MTKLQLLVPMDGTEFSRRIEGQVRKLFPPDHWELRLLHVGRVPVSATDPAYEPGLVGQDYRLYMYGYELPGTELHPVYQEERLEEYRKSLERELQEEVELFSNQGYEVTAAVHFGEPAQAIATYAEETAVDLVAMATHHRKGLGKLIYGSVAQRAFDNVSVPTLLLKVEDEEMAQDESNTSPAERSDVDAVQKDDQVVTPADTGPARLGDHSGRGVLTLVQDDAGDVVEAQGSWFPESPEANIGSLEEASHDGRTVVFEGPQVMAETAGHDDEEGEQVRREVRVTSVRSYQDYGGGTRTLVSFEAADLPGGQSQGAGGSAVQEGTPGGRATKATGNRSRGVGSRNEAQQDTMTDVPEQYTYDEFVALPLSEVVDITGLEPPGQMDANEEAQFREKAWNSYELDIEHRDEWGTARQDIPLPPGE